MLNYLFDLCGCIYIRKKDISKVNFINNWSISYKITNNIFGIENYRSNNADERKSTTFTTINDFCTDKAFMLLATSYGLTVGASFAVSTLLAQIVAPVFEMKDEVSNK